ncbi:MAG: L,D-transpeptidase [Bacillota bacterium]
MSGGYAGNGFPGRRRIWRGTLFVMALVLSSSRAARGESHNLRILINIPAYEMKVIQDGELRYTFPVAVGKPSEPTPVGFFHIACVVSNPTWYPQHDHRKPVPPGPKNPLGRWWLGLSAKGYGIHGNNNESSIGRSVSKGCIRMYNRHIEELVKVVQPGTPVEIVYRPYKFILEKDGSCTYVRIYQDIYGKKISLADLVAEEASKLYSGRTLYRPALEIPREAPGLAALPWRKRILLNGEEAGFGYAKGARHYIPARLWNTCVPYAAGTGFPFAGDGEFLELESICAVMVHPVKYRTDVNFIRIYTPHFCLGRESRPLRATYAYDKIFLNLADVARETGALFCWDGISGEAFVNRIQVAGIARDGSFWVPGSMLALLLPFWGWKWDEESMEMRKEE